MGKSASKLKVRNSKILNSGGGRMRRQSEPASGDPPASAHRISVHAPSAAVNASNPSWSGGQYQANPNHQKQPPHLQSLGLVPQPQPPQQPQPSTNPIAKLRALFSFEAQVNGDLSFRKGDILDLVDASDLYWPLARNQRTGCTGYVPYNYVQVQDGSPSSLECWFEVDRREAERKLLLPGLSRGSYMLRPCHQAQGEASVTLSVRTDEGDAVNGSAVEPGSGASDGAVVGIESTAGQAAVAARRVLVKHYMVRQGGEGYYISPRIGFRAIADLIEHYKCQQDGLCCLLSEPCPRRWMPPLQLRDFEVNRQCLTLLQKLGHGSFGEVWHAKLNRLVEVAVKEMKPGCMNKEEFLAEAKVHYKLHHPRVVQLLGVCTVEEPFYIITEFMCLGALSNYLRQDREIRQITYEDMIDMMYQVADGMTYLAKNSVVHRDLRAANILVSENNTVKVSDFGLSKCLAESAEANVESHIKFPVRWTAPEAAKNKRFTTESDAWSFGILMYEIVTRGELPYKICPNKDIIPMVSEGFRLENPKHTDGAECDDYLYDLMLHCWKAAPEERPNFAQLSEIFKTYSLGQANPASRGASEYSLSSLR